MGYHTSSICCRYTDLQNMALAEIRGWLWLSFCGIAKMKKMKQTSQVRLQEEEEYMSSLALFSVNVARNELECSCVISLHFSYY